MIDNPDEVVVKRNTPAVEAVAAGLLNQDKLKVALYYLILLIPVPLLKWVFPDDALGLTAGMVIDRLCELLVLGLISRSIVLRFSRSFRISSGKLILRTIAFGLFLWVLVMAPMFLGISDQPTELGLLYLFAAVIGLSLSYRGFFYFAPIAFGVKSWQQILRVSKEYLENDGAAPIKILLAPFGIMLFLVAAVSAIDPSGHSQTIMLLSAFCEPIFWLLSCYMGWAWILVRSSEARLYEWEVDPYLSGRLETVLVTTPRFLRTLLTPRLGINFLIIGALLGWANLMRNMSTPPAEEISIQNIVGMEDTLRVTIRLSDNKNHLSNFDPQRFMLAGESGVPVSTKVDKAIVNGREVDAGYNYGDEATVTVVFDLDRPASEVQELEDLWLWYNSAKLVHIDKSVMQGKTIRLTPGEPQSVI